MEKLNESSELNEMLKEVLIRRTEILALKEEMDRKKNELKNYEEHFISMMLEQGIKSFGNNKGISATVRESTKYSVLKENTERFHNWLEANGFGSLIKPSVHNQTMQSFFRNDYEGETPEFVKEYKENVISIMGAK